MDSCRNAGVPSLNRRIVNGVLTLVTSVAIGLIAYPYWRSMWLQDQCLDAGGRWHTAVQSCQMSECAETGSCRPSYNNTSICESMRPGLLRNELLSQLGQPVAETSLELSFQASPTERGPIVILLDEAGRSRDFYCRGMPE